MYKEDFVVAVKVDGNVLREKDQVVRLPFGSDYSLLFKNLKERKAVVSVSIDGEDVLDDSRLIIEPNSKTELKGVLDNDEVRNKFRFIKKTKEISEYRGNKIDDGIIRIEITWEQKEVRWDCQITPWITYPSYPYPWHKDWVWCDNTIHTDGSNATFYSCSSGGANSTLNMTIGHADVNDDGITVKGEKTKQDFVDGYTRSLEQDSTVITLILKGTTNGDKIVEPKLVKDKVRCPTCGRISKSDAIFCVNCGTYIKDEE